MARRRFLHTTRVVPVLRGGSADGDIPEERRLAVIVLSGKAQGTRLSMQKDTLVIGRDPDCDLVLDDAGISRRHCRIQRLGPEHYALDDLNSTNGTFVNRIQVGASEVRCGDSVRLGDAVELRVALQTRADAAADTALLNAALRDPLTNLYNRRYFEGALDRALRVARRDQSPLAVLMIDVDGFKLINDRWGHPVGDAVLRHVGAVLVGATPERALVARLGGDEFVVLVPECSHATAESLAQRLRREVRQARLRATHARVAPAISVGVATSAAIDDAAALITAADGALYDQKRGRHLRVVAG